MFTITCTSIFSSQVLLEEAIEEKKRLTSETEQLKALLKREVDKLDR